MKEKVGIMGGKGSFNDQAYYIFKERNRLLLNTEPHYLYTTLNVLKAIKENEVNYGVFGIFNSQSNLVKETVKIIGHYNFDVVDYVTIPVEHHVMTLREIQIEDIEIIMGHEDAIKQCRRKLKKQFPNIKAIAGINNFKDGAGVAEALINKKISQKTAVLSGEATAKAFNLKIAKKNLADDTNNATTMLLVKPLANT